MQTLFLERALSKQTLDVLFLIVTRLPGRAGGRVDCARIPLKCKAERDTGGGAGASPVSDKPGGLNKSTQHNAEIRLHEPQSPRIVREWLIQSEHRPGQGLIEHSRTKRF
jgi:hypothetical protein